jgi:hypothetical protein
LVSKVAALPDRYFLQAIEPLLKQCKLPFFFRRKFKAQALKLHQENAPHIKRLKVLLELLGERSFRWDKGKEQLISEGKEPDTKALLTLFIENSAFNTYRFYRREELLSQLKADKECRIRVDVAVTLTGTVAPCGRKHGEILENTRKVRKAIPPCTELRCSCDWDIDDSAC